jgi:hypothetical protein
MNFEDANKRQLLQIALKEDCPLEYKYEALRELQLRKFSDVHLQKLVKLWGKGVTQEQIAVELGIDFETVGYYLLKHGLFKVRRMGIKNGLKKTI